MEATAQYITLPKGVAREEKEFEDGSPSRIRRYDAEGLLHSVVDLFPEDGRLETFFYRDGRKRKQFEWKNGKCRETTWDIDSDNYDVITYPDERTQVVSLYHASGRLFNTTTFTGPDFTVRRKTLWYDKDSLLCSVGINGAIVPLEYYLKPESIPVDKILNEKNATTRRAYLELLGYSLFLQRTKHVVVHKEGEYELIRITWRQDEEPMMLVKVKCPSTDIFYTLRVPPTMRTCKQALAWTFNVHQDYYKLEEEA